LPVPLSQAWSRARGWRHAGTRAGSHEIRRCAVKAFSRASTSRTRDSGLSQKTWGRSFAPVLFLPATPPLGKEAPDTRSGHDVYLAEQEAEQPPSEPPQANADSEGIGHVIPIVLTRLFPFFGFLLVIPKIGGGCSRVTTPQPRTTRHGLDPQCYLTSVLAKIGQTPTTELDQFLSDVWKAEDAAEPVPASAC
jgi:hypothetical protein